MTAPAPAPGPYIPNLASASDRPAENRPTAASEIDRLARAVGEASDAVSDLIARISPVLHEDVPAPAPAPVNPETNPGTEVNGAIREEALRVERMLARLRNAFGRVAL